MNAEQILKLIEAGYTKADIDAMNNAQPVQETPEAQPVQEVQPVAGELETQTTPEVQPVKTEAPSASETDKRLDRIESIIERMAAHGIAESSAPEAPEKKNVVAEILKHL